MNAAINNQSQAGSYDVAPGIGFNTQQPASQVVSSNQFTSPSIGTGPETQGADNTASFQGGNGDPTNPNNGRDPNYFAKTDPDKNPGLPYRQGGYSLDEVLNQGTSVNKADWYKTGFDYLNNYKDAYLGKVQGYDPSGNPLPQIAGYYVYGGKYYPINIKAVQDAKYKSWSGSGGGGGGGNSWSGNTNYANQYANSDWFQNMLNWRI
jgi:hypothetical protein